MSYRVIACIDDEAVILMAMAMELRRHFGSEFVIETATSVDELELSLRDDLAEGMQLACVITDWIMPGLKGEDVAARLRALAPGLPVILMTGHSESAEAEATIASGGPVRILRKPWRQKALVDTLTELLT